MIIPTWLQWSAIIGSISGFIFSLGGLISAIAAVIQAKGAKQQASAARRAATLLGRSAQLGDIIADARELQSLLAHRHFEGIAAKCGLLRGRIVRFKHETLEELAAAEQEDLDLSRE